jgi:hypothetical protein
VENVASKRRRRSLRRKTICCPATILVSTSSTF